MLRQFNLRENYPFKFVTDTKIRCEACEYDFSGKQVFSLKRHFESEGHGKKMEAKSERKKLEESSGEPSKYKDNGLAKDLCRAFVAANIPWWKVENPVFKEFLEKWIAKNTPIGHWHSCAREEGRCKIKSTKLPTPCGVAC